MKNEVVRRVQRPDFPHWKTPHSIGSFFGFLVGLFLWIALAIVFIISLYASWFSKNLAYLLNLIKPKAYVVPFWFSLLCSIFLFPITLGIILASTLIQIWKN
jgi:hypothetical protein